jgi:hypothetical protein
MEEFNFKIGTVRPVSFRGRMLDMSKLQYGK